MSKKALKGGCESITEALLIVVLKLYPRATEFTPDEPKEPEVE